MVPNTLLKWQAYTYRHMGGDVALVYRDNLAIDVKKTSSFTSFDVIEALLSTGNDCIRLVNIYRPPSCIKHGQPTSVFLDGFAVLPGNN